MSFPASAGIGVIPGAPASIRVTVYVGWGPATSFEEVLADELRLGPAAGRARLSRAGAGHAPWQPWQEVPPAVTNAGVERAVAWRSWREQLADLDEGLSRPRPPERPGVTIGALWWSAPGTAPASWTTPAVGQLPAAGLLEFFDTFLPPDEAAGANVWLLRIDSRARVLEITSPRDWQHLVDRFPRDVTGTHDGEWRGWTGVRGPWRLPDWEQVADHYAGVHVTVGAVVTSCGVALPAADGYTTLVGWTPGATLWLRDEITDGGLLGRWDDWLQSGPWDDRRRSGLRAEIASD